MGGRDGEGPGSLWVGGQEFSVWQKQEEILPQKNKVEGSDSSHAHTHNVCNNNE